MRVRASIHRVVTGLGGFLLAASAIAAAARADFDVENGWNGQLFSSYIIATATLRSSEPSVDEDEHGVFVLGDRRGLLGVALEADEDEQSVRVTVACDAIMEPSVFSGTLPEAGQKYVIYPKIKYKYDLLSKRLQTGPVTVTYTVELADEEADERAETLVLRSVNDCPFTIVGDGTSRDVSYMFAAYVNEQHPFVDKVLREALNTEIVDSFTGYQSGDQAEVYRQTYALWHALSLRDVRYSSITTSVAQSDSVYSQHVRLIDESINNGQANCVDGSVLLASLLRKIGIEPLLVMVPGHCYLAFYLDEEGQQLAAIETTMIGSEIDGDAVEVAGLEEVAGEDFEEENSWKTFAAAIATGVGDLKKNGAKFRAATDADYQLISVAAAREHGVLPIAFQSNQSFVATPTDEQ